MAIQEEINRINQAKENLKTSINAKLTDTQITNETIDNYSEFVNNIKTEFEEHDPTVPSYVKSITQGNITSWNNKSNFSGSYNDLTNKPTIPTFSYDSETETLTITTEV